MIPEEHQAKEIFEQWDGPRLKKHYVLNWGLWPGGAWELSLSCPGGEIDSIALVTVLKTKSNGRVRRSFWKTKRFRGQESEQTENAARRYISRLSGLR